jgi:hypothetical protein
VIGWKRATKPSQPHVPLKQLERQLLDLNKLIQGRASQDAKIKGGQKAKDAYWRKKNKVPLSVLQKRAGSLARLVTKRSKTAASRKAWNGRAPWDPLTREQEARAEAIARSLASGKKAGSSEMAKAIAAGPKKTKKKTSKKKTTRKKTAKKKARKKTRR